MPSALIFLAGGTEEIEMVVTADVLRRAGVNVTVAGLAGNYPVKCCQNVTIVPDKSLNDALHDRSYDVLVCPGGMGGSQAMIESAEVGKALKDQEAKGGCIAAVCAGPIVLKAHGVAKGKKVTSHPGVKDRMKDDYKYKEDRVVVDGKIITSRGPGTCFEFALAIVEQLQGKDKAQSLVNPMLIKV